MAVPGRLMLLSACWLPCTGFHIVAPANGAILTSWTTDDRGRSKQEGSGLVEVRYYWYPEQTDALVERGRLEKGLSRRHGNR